MSRWTDVFTDEEAEAEAEALLAAGGDRKLAEIMLDYDMTADEARDYLHQREMELFYFRMHMQR